MLGATRSIFLTFLILVGCRTQHFIPPEEEQRLPRKVAQASDRMAIQLQKKLTQCGIKVVTIGSEYLVSIPATALFATHSPRLTWESYYLLNLVVEYLKQYRKVAVTVTGFSTPCFSTRREHALTLARARAVSGYIGSQGIDSRFIFTVGVGSDKPIVEKINGCDQSANARIEITFREAII
ncbi:MAG: OmpA family protein [Legionella sp.]|nr:OmpA family protein [Legionella sp.]